MPFLNKLMASFHPDLQPPEPLLRYFEWLDSQKFNENKNYYLIDPSQFDSEITIVSVEGWGNIPTDRLAPFCRTGGDGSVAALWRDDSNETHIVHLGSGSGSVMVGVLASNTIDFLRLLAIGYQELCWPEELTHKPMEVFVEENGDPDDWDEDATPPVAPWALRQWLVKEFGATPPETASEIVGTLPSYGEKNTSDHFCQWLSKIQNW